MVTTVTISDVLIGEQETYTSFVFGEIRNENNEAVPYLKFRNYGEAAEMGLFLNANPNNTPEAFGDTDTQPKYCWYLTLVNLPEGGVE